MQMEITQPGITYNDRMQGFGAVWQALRYLATGRGFMSIPSGPVLAFVRSQAHLETPDLQVHFVPFTIADLKRRKLGKTPGITASIYQLLPESRGSIHIKNTDPTQQPAIRYNFLSDPLDRQVLIDGVKWTRRILGAPSMDAIRGAELAPGDAVQSDDEILDWIRQTAQTAYHPVATCKMGTDPMAVVDPRLKVHGLAGLRIADGSIADPDVGQYQRRLYYDRRESIGNDFGGRRMNRHPVRPVTDAEIETYARDGIVCLRQVFDPEWVAFLREQVAADMANPSEMHKNVDAKDGTGHFFYDTFVSHHLPGFMRAVTDGPGAEAAGRVMGADKTNLIFDQLLVKEPGTSTETVWHHDLTYVAGRRRANRHPLAGPRPGDRRDRRRRISQGSHRWGQKFLAISFNPEEKYTEDLPEVPDIEAERDRHDIVSFDLEPGDCTIHHAATLHHAPGNTSSDVRRRAYVQRWAGDDVTYNPRPNLMAMKRDPGLAPGAGLDSTLFPAVWRR